MAHRRDLQTINAKKYEKILAATFHCLDLTHEVIITKVNIESVYNWYELKVFEAGDTDGRYALLSLVFENS